MIDFSKCPIDKPWQLVDPEGNIQMINTETQLSYARLQIVMNGLKGYYLMPCHREGKYEINEYGVIWDWPDDLFMSCNNISCDIMRYAMERKRKSDGEKYEE